MYITRQLLLSVIDGLKDNPIVAIVGPRQCGKSTLVKKIIQDYDNSIYLDLERPSDLAKLNDAEWYLKSYSDKLVCIDEIQRKPELFPILRSLVDEKGKNGNFLLLGSASIDLLQQSSESLAGRISYIELYPIDVLE